MILVDFLFLTCAAVLSGWRDANVKINPLGFPDLDELAKYVKLIVVIKNQTNNLWMCLPGHRHVAPRGANLALSSRRKPACLTNRPAQAYFSE
jgi:hypothetical protein